MRIVLALLVSLALFSPPAIAQDTEAIPPPPDVEAPPSDAMVTASGLASRVLVAGRGQEKPGPEDTVEVHYTGWTTDGKMFDSSIVRERSAKFPLNRVIVGWTEGLQLMTVGEKRRFWIPADLAYGDKPGRPQGTLVFDVELLSIEKAVSPPPTPLDVAAPPADAIPSPTGLYTKVIRPGTGTSRPGPDSKVEIHYTGWNTNGEMFDSSVVRGSPATFPLNAVIPGFSEGIQLMVEGEVRRLWIPEGLAYKGSPGKPQGMLVFDVSLIHIK